MLCHSDHNYNYFAASKLKGIVVALKLANQFDYLSQMAAMLT